MARVHHTSVGTYDVITVVSGPPWSQNCYLVTAPSSRSLLIVDPGADSPELRDAIRATGLDPSLMLVTHGHPDHLGAAAKLSEDFDLDCLVGIEDQRLVRHAPAYAAAFGRSALVTPHRIQYIDAGTEARLGDDVVTVLPAPGHTPGSLAFHVGDIVFTGDALMRERVGRTDLPGGDATRLVGSIDDLLAELPEATQLFAGHGRPWPVGEARDWWYGAGRPSNVVAK